MRSKYAVIHIMIYVVFLLQVATSSAQTEKAVGEMRRGDALRNTYRFEDAAIAYKAAAASLSDSLVTADDSLLRLEISDRLVMAENGLSMMDFAYVPEVVARHRFSTDDFFLYYPLPEGRWRRTPCQLDSTVHEFSKAVYVPDGADILYWSAEDKEGIRNIWKTEYKDSVWSVPSLLNEHVTSASDEIYPMLSPDGSKLFFSSKGLYGVGGYDIFVSEWDEGTSEWSVPVNMGFPYSSPADDFLYIDTDNGEYSVFASNRNCPKDSVWVYVLKYDDMPVRRAVSDPEELVKIADLHPKTMDVSEKHSTGTAGNTTSGNIDTRRYMDKVSEFRIMRDSIDRLGTEIEEFRMQYERSADPAVREALTERILGGEVLLPQLQDSLNRVSAMIQDIEMQMLFTGVAIDPDELLAEADKEIAGQTVNYVFTRQEPGEELTLNMLAPEPEFDYSFKILDEGQFAEDNSLPEGLVYQIQMFNSSSKATVARLKGLSPVFESRSSNGRYTYRVGLFRTYNDVLAHLNAVKKVGFRNAFIVAFKDGESITVAKAKAVEAELKKKQSLYEVRINTGKEELDMAIAAGIRQQAAGKDIARIEAEDGTTTYVVGPFADETTAENLAGFIRAMGVSNATCVEVPKK